MRPYLAIIKDSFREALASRVLWILLLLITLVFVAISPIGWQRQLTSRLGPNDLMRLEGLARRLDTDDGPTETPEGRLRARLSDNLLSKLAEHAAKSDDEERMRVFKLQRELAAELDAEFATLDFYDQQVWRGAELNEEARKLADQGLENLSEGELRRFNRLSLEAAFPRHIRTRPSRSVLFTYFNWDVGFPLPMTDEQVRDLVENTLATFMNFFVGFVGVFCGILVTASIIPSMFDAGSINLLLSKPISRSLLYLSKFIGGCSFVLINATYLILGLWLIVGWRLGIWNLRLLCCIPVFLFLFVLYYSVSGLAGLIWRNTVVCVTITIVFWFICFIVGNAKLMIDTLVHNPNRIVRIIPAAEELFSRTDNGQVRRWTSEATSWTDAFSTDGPSFVPPFIITKIGPIYDPINKRLIQVERGWPKFRLLTGTAADGWAALEVGDAPSETSALLNEQDGRPIAIASSGIVRFRDSVTPVADRPKIFGFEIPLPDQQGTSEEVVLDPRISLGGGAQVAISPTSGMLYVWKDGQLYAYQREGADYMLRNEVALSEVSQRAVMAAAGKLIVVARADGSVEVIDADSLEVKQQYHPEANNAPRYVVASPDGSFFAVVFHTRNLWVYDAAAAEPLENSWVGQGDISAANFLSDREMVVADRGNRVTEYELPAGKVVRQWAPTGSLMQRLSWYLIDPIYTIFPRPGELQQTTTYILTGKEAMSVGRRADSLDTMYLKADPWAPVWSSLAFTGVVLIISCVYISRAEF
ncbi:MAG: ABC transporter permease [Pirellulaceae bacterium]|nr:ABC transporter permease [Pirellulaceae bacterium]